MLKRFFWILAITALAGIATAQDYYHRPSPVAGRSLLTLSLFEEVRVELKTTPEVNGKEDALVDKLQGEVADLISGGGGGDPSTIFPSIEKLNNKYDDEVVKLLTADQVSRLKQLFIQYNHGAAINNPIIAKDLDLTDDQKTKLKKLEADDQQKMMDAFQGGGGSPEEMGKTLKKIQDDFSADVEKLLTDDQKKKFKDMAGATFEFKKDAGGV